MKTLSTYAVGLKSDVGSIIIMHLNNPAVFLTYTVHLQVIEFQKMYFCYVD